MLCAFICIFWDYSYWYTQNICCVYSLTSGNISLETQNMYIICMHKHRLGIYLLIHPTHKLYSLISIGNIWELLSWYTPAYLFYVLISKTWNMCLHNQYIYLMHSSASSKNISNDTPTHIFYASLASSGNIFSRYTQHICCLHSLASSWNTSLDIPNTYIVCTY